MTAGHAIHIKRMRTLQSEKTPYRGDRKLGSEQAAESVSSGAAPSLLPVP